MYVSDSSKSCIYSYVGELVNQKKKKNIKNKYVVKLIMVGEKITGRCCVVRSVRKDVTLLIRFF